MRRLAILALLLFVPTATASAGGSGPTKTVSLPVPGLQQTEMVTLTVKATAPAGKTVGPLSVRTANDAQLGNMSGIYVIHGPQKASARETITVTLLMRRWGARALAIAPQWEVTIGLGSGPGPTVTVDKRLSCTELKLYDSIFESGQDLVETAGGYYRIASARSNRAQPSPDEEVLDNLIQNLATAPDAGCTFKPEGDDPGDK